MKKMRKIGVLVCKNVSDKCSGAGCFKAFNQKSDAFELHDEEIELGSFTHCSGCDEEAEELLNSKIERMKIIGIETVHLSTCIRGRCHKYEEFAEKFAQDFDVIGYTHGSSEGKKLNNINKQKSAK